VVARPEIEEVVIAGIATDYCVRDGAPDAVAARFPTAVLTALCAGVDPSTPSAALVVMGEAGVRPAPSGPPPAARTLRPGR